LATSLLEHSSKEYERFLGSEKQKKLEKDKQKAAEKLMEWQQLESAKKEALDNSAEKTYKYPEGEFVRQLEKQRGQIRAELLQQIQSRSALKDKEKKEDQEREKKLQEALNEIDEQRKKQLEKERKQNVEGAKNEIRKALEEAENKKNKQKLEKEKEKQKLAASDERYKEMLNKFLAEKASLKNQMAKYLDTQISSKSPEKDKKEESLLSKDRNGVNSPPIQDRDLCPHGRKYICSVCNKDYPRSLLSKRPILKK